MPEGDRGSVRVQGRFFASPEPGARLRITTFQISFRSRRNRRESRDRAETAAQEAAVGSTRRHWARMCQTSEEAELVGGALAQAGDSLEVA